MHTPIPDLSKNLRSFFGIDNIGVYYTTEELSINKNILNGMFRAKLRKHLDRESICNKCTIPCTYTNCPNLPEPVFIEWETGTEIFGLQVLQQEIKLKAAHKFYIVLSLQGYKSAKGAKSTYFFIKANPSHFHQKDNLHLTGENHFRILKNLLPAIQNKLHQIGIDIPGHSYTKINALDLALNVKSNINLVHKLSSSYSTKVLLTFKTHKLSIYQKEKNIYRIEIRLIKNQFIRKYIGIETFEELFRIEDRTLFHVYKTLFNESSLDAPFTAWLNSIHYFTKRGKVLRY